MRRIPTLAFATDTASATTATTGSPPLRPLPCHGPPAEEPWEVVELPAGAAAAGGGSGGRREADGAMLGSGAKAAKPSFVSYISPEVRGGRRRSPRGAAEG